MNYFDFLRDRLMYLDIFCLMDLGESPRQGAGCDNAMSTILVMQSDLYFSFSLNAKNSSYNASYSCFFLYDASSKCCWIPLSLCDTYLKADVSDM